MKSLLPTLADVTKGVRIGAGFCASVAIAYYGASYATATWGAIPNVTSGTEVSSTAWNDIVAQLNGLAGAISVSSGNVGIGTASPQTLLNLPDTGTIRVGTAASGRLDMNIDTSSTPIVGKI